MNPFKWFFRQQPEPDNSDQFPWDRHPSVYEHIQAHLRPEQKGLAKGGEKLPDEEQINAGSKIRWAAGAMDGVSTHHMGGKDNDTAGELLKLARSYWQSPTARNKAKVYDFLVKNRVVPLIDPFLEALRQETEVNHDRLYDLGKSFATESPDRESVKFGIALLGLYGQEQDKEIFRTLGRHDEFTLFCAVALANATKNGEEELWELAKHVEGWGRVHLVERLTETGNPEIQDWLLREGYKNSIMYEYLGYSCAVGGNLLAALQRDVVDDQLLGAAGEIIQSLIAGGPAASLDDYEDGAAVVELYLSEMEHRASSLAQFLTVRAIREFLGEEKADWQARSGRGWTPEKREAMLGQCSSIIERPEWREHVLAGLKSSDELEFSRADQASSVVSIDTWPYHWDRVQQKPLDSGRWYHVMKSCPQDRIADVIALAEAKIPLGRIAAGPGTELGVGPGFEAHGCLDFILQDLYRFPGQGLRLIEAGLQSPVIRNRNMALKALVAWGRNNWPADLALLLEQARQREPEADVRRWIENAMAGKPLDEGETPDEPE